MKNAHIAAALDELADLLEFQDANPFRIRAYRNGAKAVRDLTEPVAEIVRNPDRKVTEIAGIGKDLADKIAALVDTGTFPMLDELRAQIPASAMALLRVPKLGPKKAALLLKELNIKSLDDLRVACESHQLQSLKGFGKKTEEAILAGLELAGAADHRLLWAEAEVYAVQLREHLAALPGLRKLEAAGSYRRGKETVADIDFLAVAGDGDALMDRLAAFAGVDEVIARGDTKMSVRLASGLQVDLRVVPDESFGAALQYFTGSKEHNVVLRGLAKDRGLKINEWGVYRGDERVAGLTEEDVYAAVGLPWITPELREARQEFAWASSGQLPQLIVADDIRGDLHMHTTESDGKNTLEEMVAAAQVRGLDYIAITDHSKRVSMARGLDATRLRAEWTQIDALNTRISGIQVLKGVEVDILERGGLDIDDETLALADWVVASVHYGQNQPREQINARILEAIANPNVSAIAHPTGRLINRRKPYDVDLELVVRAAADHGKFLELNASPYRLDLDDVACAMAKSRGVPIVINTDAHGVAELDKLRYGILQARRAGLTKADVANTRSWPELQKLLGKG